MTTFAVACPSCDLAAAADELGAIRLVDDHHEATGHQADMVPLCGFCRECQAVRCDYCLTSDHCEDAVCMSLWCLMERAADLADEARADAATDGRW